MTSLGGVDLHHIGDLCDEAVWRYSLAGWRRARETAVTAVTAITLPGILREQNENNIGQQNVLVLSKLYTLDGPTNKYEHALVRFNMELLATICLSWKYLSISRFHSYKIIP